MLTFGRFVASREDAGYSDGDPTVEINDTGAYKLDNIQEDAGVIQQELVEMQNAEETIDEMKDELAQAAVNYADAAGMDKPANVEIDGEEVVEVSSDTESEIDSSSSDVEDQVTEKTVELEATVENLMGKLMKTRAYKAKERLGVYSKRSRVDLQAIRANPLNAYAQTIEELGESIKSAGKAVWEWLKRLWRNIVENLRKFIPFIRNFNQKGQDLKRRADAIKRPELKNDEKGDWSEKFVIFRLFLKSNGGENSNAIKALIDKSVPENTIAKLDQGFGKQGIDGLDANGATELLAAVRKDAITLSSTSDELEAYSSTDTNLQYKPDELLYLGCLSNDLTIQAFNEDNLKDYEDYLRDTDKDAKTVKLTMGLYRLQYKENDGRKKKHEEKIGARELVDFAKYCGEALTNAGRFEQNAKKAEDKMKKLLDKLEDLEKKSKASPTYTGDDKTRGDRVFDDLSKIVKTVGAACNSLTSFPKLILSVGNEALSAVKDGDKE